MLKNLRELAGKEMLGTTELAMNLSRHWNAVAEKHSRVCDSMGLIKKLGKDQKMDYITNGVHQTTWTSNQMAKLYDLQCIPTP